MQNPFHKSERDWDVRPILGTLALLVVVMGLIGWGRGVVGGRDWSAGIAVGQVRYLVAEAHWAGPEEALLLRVRFLVEPGGDTSPVPARALLVCQALLADLPERGGAVVDPADLAGLRFSFSTSSIGTVSEDYIYTVADGRCAELG
ncbi:MAG: hypothetical protein CR993_08505 [Rhodobacterales bacterium]|nr:MAG: hypothetical protein CR993_08505 [Rhodobacterales bacterium]